MVVKVKPEIRTCWDADNNEMGGEQKTKGAQRKIAAEPTTQNESQNAAPPAPLQLQQHVLNIFKSACAEELSNDLKSTVQVVKQHLYDRNFAAAFGSEKHLWAYGARWSPPRALAYLQIFSDISPLVIAAAQSQSSPDEEIPRPDLVPQTAQPTSQRIPVAPPVYGPTRPPPPSVEVGTKYEIVVLPPAYDDDEAVPSYENPPAYGSNAVALPKDLRSVSNFRITCLGGGAGAELVAAAAWLRLQSEEPDDPDSYTGKALVDARSLEVCCVDNANWESVESRLDAQIKSPPKISRFASAARKAANIPLLPEDALQIIPIRQDLLDANLDCLRPLCQASSMITIMFTLNELYSKSVSKTQRLLFEITVSTCPGTLLLVVDSPGSYSTVTLNGTEKKYPMHWLLDHTLLEASKNTRILQRRQHWEKVLTEESRWFRLPKSLEYPIELEDMRYQIHLYRRLGDTEGGSESGPSRST